MPYQVSMMVWVGSGDEKVTHGQLWLFAATLLNWWTRRSMCIIDWKTNYKETFNKCVKVTYTSSISRISWLRCPVRLRGCKNRSAPFPGRMINQALSVLSLSRGFLWLCVVLLYIHLHIFIWQQRADWPLTCCNNVIKQLVIKTKLSCT